MEREVRMKIIDLGSKLVEFGGGKQVRLSRKQFLIFIMLLRARGEPVPNEILTQKLGTNYNTFQQHLFRLRKKLSDCFGDQKFIKAKHGVGYYLTEAGLKL
jgi:DNA-binding response OmpR family regulator